MRSVPSMWTNMMFFLSALRRTVVGRIRVTSRPVVRGRLEEELSLIAFTMKPLLHSSQDQVLLNIWIQKTGNKELMCLDVFIKKLLSRANELSYDGSFSGFPLCIMMAATSFELDIETILKSDNYTASENTALLYVYHRFVEKKLKLYQIE
jgi:hypothetical protein